MFHQEMKLKDRPVFTGCNICTLCAEKLLVVCDDVEIRKGPSLHQTEPIFKGFFSICNGITDIFGSVLRHPTIKLYQL